MPILHESHGVGGLVFAADGTLLISCGVGASYNIEDGGSISHTYYNQALTDGIIRPEENVGAFRSQMLNSQLIAKDFFCERLYLHVKLRDVSRVEIRQFRIFEQAK